MTHLIGKRIAGAAAVTGALLPASAAHAQAGGCPGEDLPVDQAGAAGLERSLECVVNDVRAQRGLPVVRAEPRLASAAARHAADMVRRRYFAHDSPSGATFVDRIRRTGYLRGARRWTVGEVLAWGAGESSTPRRIVNRWLASPPHRRVLLGVRYRQVGVGAVQGAPKDRDPSAATVSAEFGRVQIRR